METKRYFNDIFDDETAMLSNPIGWNYGEAYRLLPRSIHGHRQAAQMPYLRITLLEANGGVLHTVHSVKNTVSIVAVLQCDTAACLGDTKLKTGDLVVLDDKTKQLFFTAGSYRMIICNFDRNSFRSLTKLVAKHRGTVVDNGSANIASLVLPALETVAISPDMLEHDAWVNDMRSALQASIMQAYHHALPYRPKLTKGESYALEIRDRVYSRIEPTIAIKNFAKEYGVTEQTMQNAFKSLFGMTPYKFLRNLKLNHVRKELLQAGPKKTTVVSVANKWGFTHMGHFSGYYTQLFGENPSVTLQRTPDASDD